MTTDFYSHGSYPATGASGASASMRAELDSVEAGFAKLAALTGNGSKFLRVNASATAYEALDVPTAVAALFSSVITPTQITSNQNDYNPTSLSTATAVRISTDASRNITGMQGGTAGRMILLINAGSFNAVLQAENVGSSAANRFALTYDFTLLPGWMVLLWYDSTSTRWRAAMPQASAFIQTVLSASDASTAFSLLAAGAITLTGDISPSQITSNQNDYSPTGLSTASVLRLSTDASRLMYGLAGGSDGRIVTLYNIGSNPLTLVPDDGSSSTAANRFALASAAVIRGGQCAALIYDSTSSRWRLLSGPASPDVRDVGKNLTGGSSTASTVTALADEMVLKDTNGVSMLVSGISVTLDITASGVNGLDTGSEASSTWYYVWIIAKPDGSSVAGVLSTSSSAPTMPSGYTFKALHSACRNDGSSNIVGYHVRGRWMYYVPFVNVLSAGTSTSEASVTITSAVPPAAAEFRILPRIVSSGISVSGQDVMNTKWASGNIGGQLALQSIAGTGADNAASFTFPNISQTLYYQLTKNSTSTLQAYIEMQGYSLPNGGS